jgi:hypothetical protein
MKRMYSKVAFPATLVALVAVFLFAVIFISSNVSFADSGKKKSSAFSRPSAVEYTETQIKQLEGSLKITEAQKESWNNLTRVMRTNAQDMDALNKTMAENTKTMNAVERMKFHSQITETHLDQLKKFIPPFEAFYAGLSDEQKTITDTIFRTGKHVKHKRTKHKSK